MKLAPRPNSLSTPMLPLCSRIIERDRLNPKPVPSPGALVVKKARINASNSQVLCRAIVPERHQNIITFLFGGNGQGSPACRANKAPESFSSSKCYSVPFLTSSDLVVGAADDEYKRTPSGLWAT